MSTVQTGRHAEDRAAAFLTERGFRILERNFRCRSGELDLICLDGDCLVFVEVRSRASAERGSPLETVGPRKQRQVAKIAEIYLGRCKAPFRDIRFDVIGITGDDLDHVIDAFRIDG